MTFSRTTPLRNISYLDNCLFVYSDSTRSPKEYSYSYDPYFIYGDHQLVIGAAQHYTDRLRQFDTDKYTRLKNLHLGTGDYWDAYSVENIEVFMQEYYDNNDEVVAVAQGCNKGNGYPYWIIWTKARSKTAE